MRRSCLFIRVSSLPTISSSSWDGSLTPRSRCRILPKMPGPPEGPAVEVSVPSSRARISTAGSSACWPRIGTPAFRFFSPKRRSSQWICGMLCAASHGSRQGVSQCMSYGALWMDHMHMHMHMHMPRCHVRSRELFLKTIKTGGTKLEHPACAVHPPGFHMFIPLGSASRNSCV